MNKNTSIVIGFVVALLLGGFVGHSIQGGAGNLGAAQAITASNALNQQRLINELQLVSNVLALPQTVTASYGFGALGAVNSTTSTLSNATTSVGAALGDYVFVAPVTPTALVNYFGQVSSAGNVTIYAQNVSSTAQTPSASVFNIWDVPKAAVSALSGL